jgi:hypothetical protein
VLKIALKIFDNYWYLRFYECLVVIVIIVIFIEVGGGDMVAELIEQ